MKNIKKKKFTILLFIIDLVHMVTGKRNDLYRSKSSKGILRYCQNYSFDLRMFLYLNLRILKIKRGYRSFLFTQLRAAVSVIKKRFYRTLFSSIHCCTASFLQKNLINHTIASENLNGFVYFMVERWWQTVIEYILHDFSTNDRINVFKVILFIIFFKKKILK